MNCDLVIHDTRLGAATGNPHRVDITVRGGAVAEIAPAAGGPRRPGDIDGTRLLAFPGFVNAHAHSNESFEQGAYDGEALEPWLSMAYPPLLDEVLPARWHYLRAMLLAIHSLRSGVTALHDDLLNPGCSSEILEQVLVAYRDSGLRARVAVTLADRGYLEGLPLAEPHWPPALRAQLAARRPRDFASQAAFLQEALQQARACGDTRVQLSLGPRGPQRCTPHMLGAVADLAECHDLPVHMHVLETRTQALTARHQYGHSFVRTLEDVGLLNERLAMNHAVWIDADDIDRIARRGARVVHNPLSNFKLASGLCPVKQLLASGVGVALGTDGAASGDSLDFFDTLRMAALVHKLDASEGVLPPTAHQVLAMATANGAASMGGAGAHGALQVGQRADITLLDADDVAFVPLNDAPRQLCYAATSRSVRAVLVDGCVVYAQGRCTRIDEQGLLAEIAEAAESFRRQRLARSGEPAEALLAPLRRMVFDARQQAAALSLPNLPIS